MKIERLFFVMLIAAVLRPGASLARQADHPSQPAPAQGADKSDRNYQRDLEVRDENDEARSGKAAQMSKRPASLTKTTAKHLSSTIHSQPAVSHPGRLNKTPEPYGPRTNTPAIATGPRETSLKAAVPVRKQAVRDRNLSAPSSAVSVNGQQFRNSRDPGAHLAYSGGPLTSSRGTAAINATNMKRKP